MASAIKVDYAGEAYKRFSLSEACQKLGHKEVTIAKIKSLSQIDCMGFDEKVSKFCRLEFSDSKEFVRGLVDQERKQVICQFAKEAKIAFPCHGKRKINCLKGAKDNCYTIKKYYAQSLNLFKSFYIGQHKRSKLYCYFTSTLDE